jgi:bacterioferritin-associated ferredoxin
VTTGKTLVCTCEDVTDEECREAILEGYADMESLKRYTGLATGPCQGKVCVALARRLLAEATGEDPAEVGVITFRPPLKPVPLRFLAGERQEE